MRRCMGLCGMLAVAMTAGRASAQEPAVTIALDVSEQTGGIFASGFAAAFRGLGDVQVVSEAESPQYVLRIVVMCEPKPDDCAHATDYNLATIFLEPLSHFALFVAAWGVDSSIAGTKSDSIFARLPSTAELHDLSIHSWGRDVYQRGIREYVAKLDRQCFDRARLFHRVPIELAKGDTAAARAIDQEVTRRQWSC